MENVKVKILIIVLSILFNSSYTLAGDGDSNLSGNDYSKETQDLLTTLENKIIATVRELTDLQIKNGQEINDYHFDLNIAKKQDTNMGLVLDYAPQQKGYKVLSISPGSNAEQIGIKPQDIILKINDIEANKNNKALILQFVQSPPLDTNIMFKIKRGSKSLVFSSIAKAVQTPSFELEVGSALLAEVNSMNNQLENGNACGIISVSSNPIKSLGLYRTSIKKINGNIMKQKVTYRGRDYGAQRASKKRYFPDTYKLSPGRYRIGLVDPSLSFKTIDMELEVKPNVQYHLAVQKTNNRKKTETNNDRKAVVWHESERQCEFKSIKK